MDNSGLLVSIIMPAYNAQRYISEAIKSVLNQTFQEWELIVIDDGSIDDTASIVQAFDDKRIVYIHQDNAGVSAARNAGLSYAQGEYITFLDADDVLPKKSLDVRVDYLQKHPNVDLVDGQILVKDVDLVTLIRTYTPYYQGKLLPELLALNSHVFFNVCYMFRTEILGDIRFKNGMTHAEDLLFYIALSSKSDVMYGFVSEIIYVYRFGHASAMTNLVGLEEGYIVLLKEIKKDKSISRISYLILKLKILKIMFLSWIYKNKFTSSFSSIKNIFLLQGD